MRPDETDPQVLAIRLAQLFKTTPQFWMHMQADYDLKLAMQRRRSMKMAARR